MLASWGRRRESLVQPRASSSTLGLIPCPVCWQLDKIEGVFERPNDEVIRALSRALRQALGVSLFGIDIIINNQTGQHAVIDINAFPGERAPPSRLPRCAASFTFPHGAWAEHSPAKPQPHLQNGRIAGRGMDTWPAGAGGHGPQGIPMGCTGQDGRQL